MAPSHQGYRRLDARGLTCHEILCLSTGSWLPSWGSAAFTPTCGCLVFFGRSAFYRIERLPGDAVLGTERWS